MKQAEYVVCIYVRLSSADDDLKDDDWKDESGSITAQRELIKAYISRHEEFLGCTVIEKCDDGFSGVHFDDRPGYVEMMELAKAGKIDCIIVKDFSRLGRDYIEVGTLMETVFPFLNIRFISINDGYDSNDLKNGEIGGLDVSFKNLVYDYYARETSMKEKLSWRKSAERGDYRATVSLYGYKKSEENNKKLVVDEEAAAVVREIFSMKIAGVGYEDIARNLNGRNIPTPLEYKKFKGFKGREQVRKYYWSGGVVKNLIANEKYTGNMIMLQSSSNRITGKQTLKPSDEWVRVENTHEPIISYDDYLKANQGRKECLKKKKGAKNFFVCGKCGRLMNVQSKQTIRCRINSSAGKKVCTTTTLTLRKAEKLILYDIQAKLRIFLEEKALLAADKVSSEQDVEERLWHTKKALDTATQSWKIIYNDYADRKISREEYMGRIEEHKRIKEDLELQQENLMKELEIMRISDDKEKEMLDVAEKFCRTEKLASELKEALIDKILVYDNDVFEIYWKFDLTGLLGEKYRMEINGSQYSERREDKNGSTENSIIHKQV